jgi:hypothetical protein
MHRRACALGGGRCGCPAQQAHACSWSCGVCHLARTWGASSGERASSVSGADATGLTSRCRSSTWGAPHAAAWRLCPNTGTAAALLYGRPQHRAARVCSHTVRFFTSSDMDAPAPMLPVRPACTVLLSALLQVLYSTPLRARPLASPARRSQKCLLPMPLPC